MLENSSCYLETVDDALPISVPHTNAACESPVALSKAHVARKGWPARMVGKQIVAGLFEAQRMRFPSGQQAKRIVTA